MVYCGYCAARSHGMLHCTFSRYLPSAACVAPGVLAWKLFEGGIMSEVITELEELTPDRLTDLLRIGGALPQGRVSEVQLEADASGQAQLAHLTLTYSPDAPSA